MSTRQITIRICKVCREEKCKCKRCDKCHHRTCRCDRSDRNVFVDLFGPRCERSERERSDRCDRRECRDGCRCERRERDHRRCDRRECRDGCRCERRECPSPLEILFCQTSDRCNILAVLAASSVENRMNAFLPSVRCVSFGQSYNQWYCNPPLIYGSGVVADLSTLLYACGLSFGLTLQVAVTPNYFSGPNQSLSITYTISNPGLGCVDGPLFVYDALVGLVALNAYSIPPGSNYSYSVNYVTTGNDATTTGIVSKAAVIFSVPRERCEKRKRCEKRECRDGCRCRSERERSDRCVGRSNIVEYSIPNGSAYLGLTAGINAITVTNMLPLAISAANNVIVTFTPPPGSSMIILNNVSYPLVNGSAQFNGGSILPGGSITITYQVIGASGLMTVSVSTSTYNANSMTSLTVNV